MTHLKGLNRGKDDISNTIAAAKVARDRVTNLLAIELGNEPECKCLIICARQNLTSTDYTSDGQPIATKSSSWTPATDAASQNNWDILVGSAISNSSSKAIIQAGNSNDSPPKWGAAELIATENSTVKSYVKTYAHHNYPGGTLTSLMSHSSIVSNMAKFVPEVAAATNVGKEYVLGETNSVSGGGAAAVSPLFGAALWTMDYVLHAAVLDIKRTYFHHGTVGNCQYCFWGRYTMGAPYYGAYAATAAMAGGKYIQQLDDGKSNYAGYVIFDKKKKPLKALVYNSNFYNGSGTRGGVTFVLAGLALEKLTAKRLTAPSANSRVDQGGNPSFGGQAFVNGTCMISGLEDFEEVDIVNGTATFVVAASEALMVFLQ